MLALVGIALLWAIFGHVDEVAVATGKIIPVGQVKVVQAEDKGVVKAIHVKDGQRVKQGELLIELDQTISAAEMARLKKEVAYYELDIARLHAEQSAVPFAPKPSASWATGSVSITATFQPGTDVNVAATEVQNRVRRVEPRLPQAVPVVRW